MARILDLGPPSSAYGTRLLVEAGYDVIRVESPDGDELRKRGPFFDNVPPLEASADHQYLNAGKRSFTLNLETRAGCSILRKAVATADVLVAAWPLPLEEDELLELNPQLIVVGVQEDEPELCAVARSGLLSITGRPGERPAIPGGHVSYALVGTHVALAVSAALYARQLSGQGQVLRISVAECLMSIVEQPMVTYQATGRVTERQGYRGAVTAVSGAFPCADGYWMLSVPPTPSGWSRLMEWMQDPVLAEDRSLESESERSGRKAMILDRIDQWSLQQNKESLVTEGQNRRIPATPVANSLELVNDPQLVARGFLREIDHPLLGRIRAPMGAWATVRGSAVGRAPLLGEHSSELLQELGFPAEQRRIFLETGVV